MMADFQAFVGLTALAVIVLIFGSSRLRGVRDDDDARRLSALQRKGGKPDMAFSAGRDAANRIGMAKEVFVPMQPDDEPAMRSFYLELLDMTEMRSPNYPRDQEGFWAIKGARRAYFGPSPSFPVDLNVAPTFTVRDLDVMAKTLTTAGHEIAWDKRYSYARRLATIDPAGNGIVFVRG